MPSFENLLLLLFGFLTLAGGFALFVALRQARSTPASDALGEGDFASALDSAETGEDAPRDDLYSAAVAAKHLLELDRAGELLERILAADPDDGEAWLELGLVRAYQGDLEVAREAFARVEARRSDLWESLTLHRAWLELRRANLDRARPLFEEVEIPLETKLRTDLGAGEPVFVEWFLQAAALWQAFDHPDKAKWARDMAIATAPRSRLQEIL